uniref:Uncharacterized protein n=1 Tax=Sciurus vulgaris TaxID=55149 RepID=A0A8D2BC66_SCIVU
VVSSHLPGGTNLNKAMTLQEAEAFVGAERCIMKTLTETDLYCEPPEVQPPPKRRQKRDTTHNLPEFIVREARDAEGCLPGPAPVLGGGAGRAAPARL